jgi:cell fate regulator YaaT (PSP1 superfamily)
MGCGSSSGGCSTGGGCSSGGCSTGGGCSSGGCSSGGMSVHDWLSGVTMPGDPFSVIEISFKGGRKGFYRNINNFVLATNDLVVVDAGSGHNVGTISLQGELVRLQMVKKKVKISDDLPVIYRVATQRDLDRHEEAKNREISTLYRGREIINDLSLGMKLSDIEYQSDNTKATFYYSADDRVDFRELIKSLASEFRIRVEMKQISLRQEAARVGGIGSCGRELCCTTWLSDFKNVSTSAARYQNLSLNPLKLSGQCGRLKCCLNYELDTYLFELKDIPKVDRGLKTEDGEAYLFKTDIFKKMMWFGYKGDTNWHAVPVARVKEILTLNKNGEKPLSLLLDETEEVEEIAVNHDLLQLDKKYSKGKSKNKGRQKGKNQSQVNKKPSGRNPQNRTADNSKTDKKPDNNRRKSNSKGGNPESATKQNSVAEERPKRESKAEASHNERKPQKVVRKSVNTEKEGGKTEKPTTLGKVKNSTSTPKQADDRRPKERKPESKRPEKKRTEHKIEVVKDDVVKKRPVRAKVKIQREQVKEVPNETSRSESKAGAQRQNKKDDEK